MFINRVRVGHAPNPIPRPGAVHPGPWEKQGTFNSSSSTTSLNIYKACQQSNVTCNGYVLDRNSSYIDHNNKKAVLNGTEGFGANSTSAGMPIDGIAVSGRWDVRPSLGMAWSSFGIFPKDALYADLAKASNDSVPSALLMLGCHCNSDNPTAYRGFADQGTQLDELTWWSRRLISNRTLDETYLFTGGYCKQPIFNFFTILHRYMFIIRILVKKLFRRRFSVKEFEGTLSMEELLGILDRVDLEDLSQRRVAAAATKVMIDNSDEVFFEKAPNGGTENSSSEADACNASAKLVTLQYQAVQKLMVCRRSITPERPGSILKNLVSFRLQ